MNRRHFLGTLVGLGFATPVFSSLAAHLLPKEQADICEQILLPGAGEVLSWKHTGDGGTVEILRREVKLMSCLVGGLSVVSWWAVEPLVFTPEFPLVVRVPRGAKFEMMCRQQGSVRYRVGSGRIERIPAELGA